MLVRRLTSLLVLALAAPSIAQADVPPLVPHVTTSITITSDDTTHAWVAYPLNYSRGVPMEAYAQITPGAPIDAGRAGPAVYAFPVESVVDLSPDVRGLLGAPRGFGQSDTAFGDHALAPFFTSASAPHAPLLAPPQDSALVALHVTSLVDAYAPTVDGSTLTLRLVQTTYTLADAATRIIPANADGSRALPGDAPAVPPRAAAPATTTPTPSTTTSAPAAPAASGWGCSVGARSSGAMFGLFALALIALRRRH